MTTTTLDTTDGLTYGVAFTDLSRDGEIYVIQCGDLAAAEAYQRMHGSKILWFDVETHGWFDLEDRGIPATYRGEWNVQRVYLPNHIRQGMRVQLAGEHRFGIQPGHHGTVMRVYGDPARPSDMVDVHWDGNPTALWDTTYVRELQGLA